MDTRRPTLADFDDPEQYVVLPDRNVFDEHVEEYHEPVYDAKGEKVVDPKTKKPKTKKVVWNFDKEELQRLAAINNARNAAGDFTPLAIGHTDQDNPNEQEQPPIVGIAAKYHVAWDQPHQRWMLRSNYYIRKKDFEKAREFPYTSIELHPSDGAIHPISLIRRTPQRNLGAWTFHRQTNCYSLTFSRFDTTTRRCDTVLRYSRFDSKESNMAEMNDMPVDDEGGEMTEKYMRDVMPHIHAIMSHPHHEHMVKKYAMEEPPIGTPNPNPSEPPKEEPPLQHAAAPSATNGCLPKPVKEDEVRRMQRDQDAIRFARYEKEMADLRAIVTAQQETNKATALQYARSESEKLAQQLVYEGYDVDIAEEVTRMAPMSGEDRVKHADYIRKYHRKAPVQAAPMLHTKQTTPMGGMDEDVIEAKLHNEALQYQRKHKGLTFDQALAEVEKKKGLASNRN